MSLKDTTQWYHLIGHRGDQLGYYLAKITGQRGRLVTVEVWDYNRRKGKYIFNCHTEWNPDKLVPTSKNPLVKPKKITGFSKFIQHVEGKGVPTL